MTKRWDNRVNKYEENKRIDDFISEIIEVCQKHKLSISHEDQHGAFIIDNYEGFYTQWLNHAHIDRTYEESED